MSKLNAYFADLENTSKIIDRLEGNVYVLEHTNFEGTAAGSKESAEAFIPIAKEKIVKLQEKLNEVFTG